MDKKRRFGEMTESSDKQFVEDGMTTADIRKTVVNIRQYIEKGGSTSLDDRIKKLQTDHAFFVERYPMLFDMCVRPDFNFENLNYFLKKRDEIIENKVSCDDASKQIGQEWFNKYVDISKLPKKD
jgi:hypothetical protein